jgi:hypothetical protein
MLRGGAEMMFRDKEAEEHSQQRTAEHTSEHNEGDLNRNHEQSLSYLEAKREQHSVEIDLSDGVSSIARKSF